MLLVEVEGVIVSLALHQNGGYVRVESHLCSCICMLRAYANGDLCINVGLLIRRASVATARLGKGSCLYA